MTLDSNNISRRQALQSGLAASTAGMLMGLPTVHAGSDKTLKVGLVGCGGRGTGAATDALNADEGVKITALGDMFNDHLQPKLSLLRSQYGKRIEVTPETSFVGADAYKKVIDSGVDVVLLCTPPHFRPAQLEYAIEKGKHVFCEKPVAVDAPGVRRCIQACAMAKEKKLSVVSGLCWRYANGMIETINRVKGGDIGKIISMNCIYNARGLWSFDRQPEWSDMEWQLRNWLYFTWLSGDHNVEQHVHSLDKAMWLMNDEPPVNCFGLGGRQARTDPKFGHIFDHHAVCYEFKDGVRLFAYTRQQDGTHAETEDYIFGTEGRAKLIGNQLFGPKAWKYKKTRNSRDNMYLAEHQAMFEGIRSGNIINNGDYMCKSTLLAIMGRMATYTGQLITWDMAMNSKEDLTPPSYDLKAKLPVHPVAIPGRTAFDATTIL